MSEVSVVRLMIGGALGPIGAILYAVGFRHLYLAMRDGDLRLAQIAFVAFATMMAFGGAVHSNYVTTGLVLRAREAAQAADLEVMETLLEQSDGYIRFLYIILGTFGLVASFVFVYAVLARRTRYPRWIVFLTPTLLTLAFPLTRFVPSPVGGIVFGGFANIAFLIFFIVSTSVLWKG